MSFYKHHLFFCTNIREDGVCCQEHDAAKMRDYAKRKTKELGIAGQGGVRVNKAGCLDRCSEGPCVVVYPDAIWYAYETKEDVDEIIDEHLLNGRVVKRLQI